MPFFSGQFLVTVVFWQNSSELFALSRLHTDNMLIHTREHAGSLPCEFKRIVFQVRYILYPICARAENAVLCRGESPAHQLFVPTCGTLYLKPFPVRPRTILHQGQPHW